MYSLCHDSASHEEESKLNSHSGFPTEPNTTKCTRIKNLEFWDTVESLTDETLKMA